MKPLRFGESVSDPGNLVFLEWPEQVSDALPENSITLSFFFVDDTTRKVLVPHGILREGDRAS
jgi:tRNA A37 threonylcarbamoyladenosine biosynthesis protein TsaE